MVNRLRTMGFQPEPILTLVNRMSTGPGVVVTAIFRRWEPGMTRFCRLCPDCGASDGMCLLTTTAAVANADARMFSAVGLPIRDMEEEEGGPARLKVVG